MHRLVVIVVRNEVRCFYLNWCGSNLTLMWLVLICCGIESAYFFGVGSGSKFVHEVWLWRRSIFLGRLDRHYIRHFAFSDVLVILLLVLTLCSRYIYGMDYGNKTNRSCLPQFPRFHRKSNPIFFFYVGVISL